MKSGIGVGWSHFRFHRCSINWSVMLSVESESIVSKGHANEITESRVVWIMGLTGLSRNSLQAWIPSL